MKKMILDIQSEEVKQKLGYYDKPDKLTYFLRENRINRGYTLRRFAVKLGMTPTEYTKLEKGEIRPTKCEIETIADCFDVDIEKLTSDFKARVPPKIQ